MHFRPYPVLTVVAVPILALLVWLGSWQSSRAAWKQGLIDDFMVQAAQPAIPAGDALCAAIPEPGTILTGDSVRALAPASASAPIRMFGPAASGQPGWALLMAVTPPDCRGEMALPLLHERNFEPLQAGPVPPSPRVSEPPARYILSPWPAKSAFAAENDPAGNDWHWFDPGAMAAALGTDGLETGYYLKAFSGELPDRLSRTPPATHYGYAATWFGMAIAFLVIYAAFHARAGRLRFGRKRTGD